MKRATILLLTVAACLAAHLVLAEVPPSWFFVVGSQGSAEGQFLFPGGAAVFPVGNTVLIADKDNHRIVHFDNDGNFLQAVGFGVQDGSNVWQVCSSGCQAGLPGSQPRQFSFPEDIAFDTAGNSYIADSGNERIQVLDTGLNFVRTIGAGGGAEGFDDLTEIAITATGEVFAVDQTAHRILKFDNTGAFERVWGWGVQDGSNVFQICTSGCQITGIGGAGDGQFNDPKGIAVDGSGNVFVADEGNHRVQKFDSNGNFLMKWGAFGTGDGQFDGPQTVDTDANDRVYVGDSNRIQKFDGSGSFIVGFGSSGTGNGQFDEVNGVAVADGEVFAVDRNHRLQKFGRGFFVLDAFGAVHASGGAPPLSAPTPYFGFNIARDLELGASHYVLDGFGGLHPGGGAPAIATTPYFGFDITRDFELLGGGYYLLDGFGGVHVGNTAPAITAPTPYLGFDIARDLELLAGGPGFYVVDGFGGIHRGNGASAVPMPTPYFGFDIVRDAEIANGGYYALDGFGGVHAGSGAPVLGNPTPYFGFDIARDVEFEGHKSTNNGYYVLDGFGGLHPGGGAAAITPLPPYFGFESPDTGQLRFLRSVAQDLEISGQ